MNDLFGRVFAAGLFVAMVHPAFAAEIELVARGSLSSTDRDLSGLTDDLKPGVPHNLLGGLSALEYSGVGTKYYALPDRGPADGAVPYQCRLQVIDIQLPTGNSRTNPRVGMLDITLLETRMLRAEDNSPLVGDASAIGQNHPTDTRRFDPEGLRHAADGRFYISDEYGPSVREFSPLGKQLRALPVPPRFQILHPSASKDEELANNSAGRQTNGGMEGLCLTPSGKKLFGIMQRPLIQDSVAKSGGKRSGIHNRLLEIDLPTGHTREFIYPLDDEKNGISEILAINEHDFLLIERDGEKGTKANYKKIIYAHLDRATDVTEIESLPPHVLPKNVVPLRKAVLIDLLDPRFGLAGETFPEKVEGITFGPRLPDGRLLLMVGIDNDFIAEQPSLFLAFSIDPKTLPDFAWKP